jgi:topoisomerase IA-like protein
MANFEKLYQRVAEQVIQRCHGAIKITKHGKIIEVYDTKRHIWSDGLAGLIIKEESKNANLREWEVARCIRPRIITMLLEDKEGLLSNRLPPDNKETKTRKRLSSYQHTKKPLSEKAAMKKRIYKKDTTKKTISKSSQ